VRPFFLHAAFIAVIGAGGCSELPRDPHGSLDRVRGGTLRVGLVETPPWVVERDGQPAGAEVELVKRLAAELGATPQWVLGGSQSHMEALERCQLDLVIGGVTKDTPWKDRVGLAGPYFEDRVFVGVPDPAAREGLRGLSVRVKRGDVAAAYVRKKHAAPVEVSDLRGHAEPAAAPDWELEVLGLTPVGDELQTRKHVWAVPPGENAWIKHLEEFFDREGGNVRALLQQEAARQ